MTEAKEKDIIEERFTYHAPTEEQVKRLKSIREKAKELAREIDSQCPPSADRTAAMRKLEEAVMTANKAIVLEDIGGYR